MCWEFICLLPWGMSILCCNSHLVDVGVLYWVMLIVQHTCLALQRIFMSYFYFCVQLGLCRFCFTMLDLLHVCNMTCLFRDIHSWSLVVFVKNFVNNSMGSVCIYLITYLEPCLFATCFQLLLADLVKWTTQSMQLGYNVVIIVVCIIVIIIWHGHWWYHLCTAVLVTWLIPVAYILAYFPHWCTWNNLGMWHLFGIWGEYLLLTHICSSRVNKCCNFIWIYVVMWGLYIDYIRSTMGHLFDRHICSGAYASNV